MDTARERVRAQICHKESFPVPYTLGFEGDVVDRLDRYYGGLEWRSRVDSAIVRVPVPNLVIGDKVASEGKLQRGPYGSIWRTDRRPFHLEQPVLREPSLDGYQWPDPQRLFSGKWELEARAFCAEHKQYFLVAGFGFGLFERSWALRGFAEALMDAAADPRFYEELVTAIADHQMQILDRLVDLPIDGIMFSDDWGYQQGVLLGNERWRRFIKPNLERMYAKVHAAGKFALSHCCGSVRDIMGDIIEVGLDVLESVQPEARGMSPFELKTQYGRDIAFWGGLGSQSTIPFAQPQEIRTAVRLLCSEMGRGGGYVLAPSKPLQADTPTENAAAVVDAFLDESQ